ncbi:MAG: hypothetical protein LLG00_13985, partial [Planctomycetaceae bacterium]|nr:hypothetical protein [Planctomycetaceae bacterium]
MRWNKRVFRGRPKASHRPSPKFARGIFERLELRLTLSTSVLTYHNDIASTGLNAGETLLTPTNVNALSFGKLFATPLDGQVYAQPLADPGVTIAAGVNTTAGASGIHDVALVATEHDSLYAVDANPLGNGSVLWKRSFIDIITPGYSGSAPGSNINSTLGATTITTVPNADVQTTDITPEIGITGTPVIDPATSTLYVVVKTKETIAGTAHYVQRLHAINIADGTDRAVPYLIGDTSGGNANNTQIYVYGAGDGRVIDPYNATGKNVVQFNALRENQRGALSLVNNVVYVEWASHGDKGPYHGWVAGWNVSNLTQGGFALAGVFNSSPNGGLTGIWQGGGRLAFEADGSAFYFETGNGPSNHANPVLDANGFPADGNYYDALVKVVPDPTTTATNQGTNGWGFRAADYFIPYNQVALDSRDTDFGSGGPLLLPDSAGIPGHAHLMLAAGKQGKIYLVDRDNLGKFNATNDNVINSVPDGAGHNTPPVVIAGVYSTPAYYSGTIYYVAGILGTAEAFTISSNGTLVATSRTAATFGDKPGSPSISANGATAGVVWVMDRNANEIHAFDATSFNTELWNSGQKAGGADSLGSVVKFASPTVANGEVFVGTSTGLVVYGLVPTLTLTGPTSGTFAAGETVPIQWTAANVPAGSVISLCYDKDTIWGNGNETWIEVDQVAAASGAGSYNWNTTGVAGGTYYLAGYMWSGSKAYLSHLTQAITIQGGAAPAFTLTGPTSGTFTAGATIPIQWTAANVPAGSVISLCYDKDTIWGNGNETWIAVNHAAYTGAGVYNWNTTGVTPGNYYIAGYLYANGAPTCSHLTTSIAIQPSTPAFTVTSPTSGTFSAGQTVAVQWNAANVPAGSTIALCYDTDNVWGQGVETWITLTQTAANGTGSYNWNTTGVAPGNYYMAGYLYANGTATPSHDLEPIKIQTAPSTPTFNILSPTSGTMVAGQTVQIMWNAGNVPVGATIALCYDTDAVWGSGTEHWITVSQTANNGYTSYDWNTSGVAPGRYYVAGYLYSAGTPTLSHLTQSITVTAAPAATFAMNGPTAGIYLAGQTVSPIWTASNVPAGSTVSVCYDTDAVWNGNETWIAVDKAAINGS